MIKGVIIMIKGFFLKSFHSCGEDNRNRAERKINRLFLNLFYLSPPFYYIKAKGFERDAKV